MKKLFFTMSLSMALLVTVPLVSAQSIYSNPFDPIITVDPTEWNFGEIPAGQTRSMIFTLTYNGTYELTVDKIQIGWPYKPTDGTAIFLISNVIPPPNENGDWILQPGESAWIEVATVPGTGGFSELGIGPFGESSLGIVIPLSSGIGEPSTPDLTIEYILSLFDAWVKSGILLGSGPGASAPHRLNALRNMIVASGDLMARDDIEGACRQMLDAYNRTDGMAPPPDFAEGPAASTLAALIQEFRQSFGCL